MNRRELTDLLRDIDGEVADLPAEGSHTTRRLYQKARASTDATLKAAGLDKEPCPVGCEHIATQLKAARESRPAMSGGRDDGGR